MAKQMIFCVKLLKSLAVMNLLNFMNKLKSGMHDKRRI